MFFKTRTTNLSFFYLPFWSVSWFSSFVVSLLSHVNTNPFSFPGFASCESEQILYDKITKKYCRIFLSFFEDNCTQKRKKIEQNDRKNVPVFQNDSFYIAKWAILLVKMNRFARQNGPF